MSIHSLSWAAVLAVAGAIGSAHSSPIDLGNWFTIDSTYGQVVDKHFDPKNRKTIFYVLDHHAGGNGLTVFQNGLDPVWLTVQKNAFPIIDSLLKKGMEKGIGFVHEWWNIKPRESQADFIQRNLIGFKLRPNMKDAKGRVALDGWYSEAQRLAGASIQQSGNLLSAVYTTAWGKIEHTASIIPESTQLVGDVRNMVMRNYLSTPVVPCKSVGRNSEMSLWEASTRMIQGQILTGEDQKCGCDGLNEYSYSIKNWVQNRYYDAARAEIDAAKKVKYDHVIINVGSWHGYHAIEYAKKSGVNYVVIAPHGSEVLATTKDPAAPTMKITREYGLLCRWILAKENPSLRKRANDEVSRLTEIWLREIQERESQEMGKK